MAKKAPSITQGAIGWLLYTDDFHSLTAKLARWRRNPVIQLMNAKKDKGKVLDFIKGLRVSSGVANLARKILSTEVEVEVSWGHLVDKSGVSCSPECDIIVHRTGFVERWNGGEKPIMDFKFINCEEALAVISCKSFAKSVDKTYCKKIAKYGVDNVMLFAECCAPQKVASLTKQARDAGYSGFYYLYTYEAASITDGFAETSWMEFIDAVMTITATGSRRKKVVRRPTAAGKRQRTKTKGKETASKRRKTVSRKK